MENRKNYKASMDRYKDTYSPRNDIGSFICCHFRNEKYTEAIEPIEDEKFLIGIQKEKDKNCGIYLLWSLEEGGTAIFNKKNYQGILLDQKKYNLDPYYYVFGRRKFLRYENVEYVNIFNFMLQICRKKNPHISYVDIIPFKLFL